MKFFTKIRIVHFIIFVLPFRCLRYASTGNFPPGSYMGRNFVHDPKMNKASVVNAHLKMSFISNDNKRYIISRSVQAKQGPKQVQIKTLDSTLRQIFVTKQSVTDKQLNMYLDSIQNNYLCTLIFRQCHCGSDSCNFNWYIYFCACVCLFTLTKFDI